MMGSPSGPFSKECRRIMDEYVAFYLSYPLCSLQLDYALALRKSYVQGRFLDSERLLRCLSFGEAKSAQSRFTLSHLRILEVKVGDPGLLLLILEGNIPLEGVKEKEALLMYSFCSGIFFTIYNISCSCAYNRRRIIESEYMPF